MLSTKYHENNLHCKIQQKSGKSRRIQTIILEKNSMNKIYSSKSDFRIQKERERSWIWEKTRNILGTYGISNKLQQQKQKENTSSRYTVQFSYIRENILKYLGI